MEDDRRKQDQDAKIHDLLAYPDAADDHPDHAGGGDDYDNQPAHGGRPVTELVDQRQRGQRDRQREYRVLRMPVDRPARGRQIVGRFRDGGESEQPQGIMPCAACAGVSPCQQPGIDRRGYP